MTISQGETGSVFEQVVPFRFKTKTMERGPARAASPDENRAIVVRYSLFNSVSLFLFAYGAYFLDGFNFLWTYDATRFSFLIIGIYLAVTAYIGVARAHVKPMAVYFVANRLTSIGLIGTVIGIMLLMYSVGSSNVDEVARIFSLLVKGMSTLLITTLCGMAFSLLIDLQMWVVFGRQPK